MLWDDLRRLLGGKLLYRLDTLIGPRLVPVLYAFGLAAIGLWAIDHLFASFAFNFGQGLWGILEVLVYGPLWLIALRIVAESVLIYFKTNEAAAAAIDRNRARNTLLEDLGDAIHDLADDDEDDISPATDPVPFTSTTTDIDPIIKGTLPRRTARRTPPAKT